MTRIAVVPIVLLVLSTGFCAAQEQYRPILVSIKSEADLPLPPDPLLFQPGGGVGMRVSYVFPFLRPLSAGVGVVYHLGPLQHADLGNLGSLSLISVEAAAEFRLTFLRGIDVYLAAGAGYFYTFLNADPSEWA